jgi:hypothetical protein
MNDFLTRVASDAQAIMNAEFSEPFSISNGTVTANIRGIVDMTHEEVDMQTQTLVMSIKPRISVWSPDVPFPIKVGYAVTLRGASYIIRDVEQLGDQDTTLTTDGSVILILNPAK